MSTKAPQDNSQERKPTIWADLKSAGLIAVGIVAVALYVAYAAFVEFGPLPYEKLGLFGDSFGAITSLFNALAFAALIATVVLQGRELRESRQELAKQARAQEAWALAAAEQIKLTRQLESIRIRPFIKLEWHQHPVQPHTWELRIRNVGLGVAIVRSFELWAGQQIIGTVEQHGINDSAEAWRLCIEHAASANRDTFDVALQQFDDLNRALAPGELQAVMYLNFRQSEQQWTFMAKIRRNFRPIIHFYAADGRRLSTRDQFDELKKESGAQFGA